ncbi:MoaD/ThiS family protein [Bradyrhizobium sp. CB2312]|uniref:MoaD/ThiS family protein n=1 Tax=Bradyrhizobium sp. CB2312 TaxID=3039155 RepID=UPI0024B23088|nr:MoaD/ThiS family protein [Bradyrhizobium sp. CB2312]WFU71493.1 MoaD/ThiS family protein [Bradyrhizobium sp. CB2312]
MIRVEVNMHGNLRRFLPGGVGSIQLDLPEGATILNVVGSLSAEHEVWLASIGDMVVPLSAEVKDGAELNFFPYLEGG